MRTVKEEWISYLAVLPPEASKIQIQETRRAFYAGCVSLLRLLADLEDDELSDDAGAHIIEGLQAELDAFQEAIGTPMESKL